MKTDEFGHNSCIINEVTKMTQNSFFSICNFQYIEPPLCGLGSMNSPSSVCLIFSVKLGDHKRRKEPDFSGKFSFGPNLGIYKFEF